MEADMFAAGVVCGFIMALAMIIIACVFASSPKSEE